MHINNKKSRQCENFAKAHKEQLIITTEDMLKYMVMLKDVCRANTKVPSKYHGNLVVVE